MSSVAEMHNPDHSRLKAIGLMCGAILVFSGIDTIAKYLSTDYHTVEIVWARYAGHMAFTLLLFRPRTIISQTRSNRPWLQVLRGALLFGGTVLNFLAVKYLQLTEAVSIFFISPLLVAALSMFFLGEKVGARRWAAILVGFVGVMVIVRPGFGGLHWAVIFSFGAVTSYSLYSIATRMLANVDSPQTSLLYSAMVGFVLMTPLVPFFWTMPVDAIDWSLFVLIGLGGAFGHYLLILAHVRAGASVLAPFIFTSIIWMTINGYFIFGDVPGGSTLLGASIVIASGLYLLNRERRVKAEGGDQPSYATPDIKN